MKKSELNQNIRISESNVKLNHLKNKGIIFLMFSLPSLKSCPFTTEKCKSSCFGNRGVFAMPNNRKCYDRNLNKSKKDTFVIDMINHLEYQLTRKKTQGNIMYFRIHQTGDFYNKDYYKKWLEISEYFIGNKYIKFQAYTKSISFVDDIPRNIQLIFSQMPDTNTNDIIKAKSLNIPIYNTVEMKIDDFEKLKTLKPFNNYCNGVCEDCLSCYEANSLTLNRLRKNGEPSKYKNTNLNDFWTNERKADWTKNSKIQA